jgi:hypothetical protein
MKHFKFFPKIEYDNESVTDIFRRAVLHPKVKNVQAIYSDIRIIDGGRADNLAFEYYRDVDLEWLFFYANDIQDPILDWPLESNAFNDYISQKYQTNVPERVFKPLGKIGNVWIDNTEDQRIVNFTSKRYTPIEIGQTIKHPFRDEYRKVIDIINEYSFVIDSIFSQPFPNSASQMEYAEIYTNIHSFWDLRTGHQIDYSTWLTLNANRRKIKTYYEYEFELNENKRKIQVISKSEAASLYNELLTIFKK